MSGYFSRLSSKSSPSPNYMSSNLKTIVPQICLILMKSVHLALNQTPFPHLMNISVFPFWDATKSVKFVLCPHWGKKET